MQGYQIQKVLVKHQLQKAVSKVHIAFDLWTPGNYSSLNGIVAHFIDADFKPQAILLATPKQSSSHAGVNIADQVIKVIEDFGIQSRLGYFVLDNASNNDTAMRSIAEYFKLDAKQCRLRCAGHIINLVAPSLVRI
jgi:hypothetical protein